MDIPGAVTEKLAEALAACRKVGTVTAISGTRVIVSVSGGSMTLPRMAHYTPTVGDVIQIDATVQDSWVVLGKVA